MTLSLRELKEYLIAKEGYTINPNHNQLADLKELVNDMINVRNESPPSSGPGSYSGTTCNGHQNIESYSLSLGDIKALDIKGCSCNAVENKTAYCESRTYICSCNSNTPACECNTRTYTCSCNSNSPTCTCNSRTTTCDCYSRWGEGDNLHEEIGGKLVCICKTRTAQPTCTCNMRYGCDCEYRTSSCGSRNTSDVQCGSRTSSCGSRDTTSCTCNGRCACNTEKRFE